MGQGERPPYHTITKSSQTLYSQRLPVLRQMGSDFSAWHWQLVPTWRAVELAKRGCHTRLTLWHSRQPSRQRWDGQGRLRCTQGHSARHASMGGLFVLLPTAPPLEHDSLHTPSLPRECPPQHHSQPLTTEGKTLFPVLGDRGKGLLGKKKKQKCF